MTITNTGLANGRKLLLGVFVSVALMSLAAPAFAQDSWDTKITGANRFVVLVPFASAAVLDKETGIVWERSPAQTNFTWATAQNRCNRLVIGGRMGWRLPTIQELTSVLSVGAPGGLEPRNPFNPINPISATIWSGTTSASNPAQAWVFGLSGNATFLDKTRLDGCWCVRFRQGVDPQ